MTLRTWKDVRLLTAKLSALADWRDDIAERIEHAIELRDRGALFDCEIDDLNDAVAAWRRAAGTIVLGMPTSGAMEQLLYRRNRLAA